MEERDENAELLGVRDGVDVACGEEVGATLEDMLAEGECEALGD